MTSQRRGFYPPIPVFPIDVDLRLEDLGPLCVGMSLFKNHRLVSRLVTVLKDGQKFTRIVTSVVLGGLTLKMLTQLE